MKRLFELLFALSVFSQLAYAQEEIGPKYEAAMKRVRDIVLEIKPYFSEEEDAPGNGAAYLRKLISSEGFKENHDSWGKSWEDGTDRAALARDWMHRNPGWPDAIRKLAEFDRFRFKREMTDGWSMELNELGPIRHLFRLNREVLVELARQEGSGAYLKIVEGSQQFVTKFDEPVLISYLVVIACDALLMDGITRSLPFLEDPDVVKGISDLLSDRDILAGRLAAVTKGEIALFGPGVSKLGIENIIAFLNASKILDQIGMPDFMEDPVPDPAHKDKLIKEMREGGVEYLTTEKYNYLSLMLKLPEISALPLKEGLKRSKEEFSIPEPKKGNILASLLLIDYGRLFDEQFRSISRRRIVRAVLQTHLYKLKTGKLPASLKDIPKYKEKVPKGPYNDKPLVYVKSDKPLYFRIKDQGMDGVDSGEYLKPPEEEEAAAADPIRFGWQKNCEENIYGVDYPKKKKRDMSQKERAMQLLIEIANESGPRSRDAEKQLRAMGVHARLIPDSIDAFLDKKYAKAERLLKEEMPGLVELEDEEERFSRLTQAYYYLGWASYYQDKTEEAIQAFRQGYLPFIEEYRKRKNSLTKGQSSLFLQNRRSWLLVAGAAYKKAKSEESQKRLEEALAGYAKLQPEPEEAFKILAIAKTKDSGEPHLMIVKTTTGETKVLVIDGETWRIVDEEMEKTIREAPVGDFWLPEEMEELREEEVKEDKGG
ncbi:tol-pal system YbgF family protein [Planctomycetota bacterium]